MIIVSDTSPLNYLVLLNAVHVLPRLFQQVYVPPEVMRELQRSRTPPVVRSWACAPPEWLVVKAPTRSAVFAGLHLGEASAIALALELRASLVLIDERKGRRVATDEGLNVIGTMTVLELAAERRLIELKPVIEALRKTTFRISDQYIIAALERDAARKSAAH